MSWDAYVDNLIGHGQGHIDSACIMGLDGAPWTGTTDNSPKHLKPVGTEGPTIAGCLKSKNFDSFRSSGVHVAGKKYMFLRADEEADVVLAKGTGSHKEEAICIQKTNTAFIIAHCPAGQQPGKCNTAVEVIAQYLKQLNYWMCWDY